MGVKKLNRIESAQKIHACRGLCEMHACQVWWACLLWFRRYCYLSILAKFPFRTMDYMYVHVLSFSLSLSLLLSVHRKSISKSSHQVHLVSHCFLSLPPSLPLSLSSSSLFSLFTYLTHRIRTGVSCLMRQFRPRNQSRLHRHFSTNLLLNHSQGKATP